MHYRVNPESAVFGDLAGLLRKTAGLAEVLRDALAPVGDKIDLAFVYGSVASATERPESDVDVMVFGSASFGDLARALASTQDVLRRDVNPTVMTSREFARKLKAGDGFARSVVRGARLWLIGGEDDFAELAANRAGQGARGHAR